MSASVFWSTSWAMPGGLVGKRLRGSSDLDASPALHLMGGICYCQSYSMVKVADVNV